MISLAAAITIQKIADSKIAITILLDTLYILANYETTLTTLLSNPFKINPLYCIEHKGLKSRYIETTVVVVVFVANGVPF